MFPLAPETSSRSRLSYLSVLTLITVGYFVAGKIGLSLAPMHGSVSLIWPATGIALASLLLLGYRLWPGVFLGAFLVNVSTPVSLATAFSISCGNTLEALAGAYLIRKFSGDDARLLERLRGVFSLVLFGAVAATMISGTIGVISLCVGGAAPWNLFAYLWMYWWMGDVFGALIFTPLLLSWNRPAGFAAWQRLVEAGVLMVLMALASLFVFRQTFGPKDLPYFFPYIVFPFVLWASMRFTQWGAAHATLLVSFISIWGTVQGFGPFAKPTAQESLTLLHVFMVTVSLTGLFLAAVVSEAKRVREVNRVRAHHNEVAAAITHHALSSTDVDTLLRHTVARVAETLDTEYCKILQFLPDGTKSLLRAGIGWQEGYVGKTIGAVGVDSQSDQLSHPCAPILVNEPPTKTDLEDGQLQENHQVQAGMSVSIPGTPRPFGILGVDSRRQITFTDNDRDFLQSVANVLASAMARARVEENLRMLTSTLEARVIERTESLRRSEALAAIGVTAAKFAHEVGNPLNSMFTTVQLLERYLNKQRDEFDDVIIATARDLRKEIDRLRLVLHDFRSLAQLPTLNLKPIAIAAVVADFLRSQEYQHNGANIQFEQHLFDLPPVIADSGALTQVLMNLFQNSLEAMPRGGTITLRGTCSGNKLYLDVIDTGMGVSSGIDIFEPFASTKFSGTGLGLTVARQLMEAQGGSITLESETGKGAVFRLALPIDSA